MLTENENTRCGYVAIVGRPNVGKSTLLNQILGQKLSITCRKAQTTRHRILGVKTNDEHTTQAIYVDTPGLHLNAQKELNRMMNKAVTMVMHDVDLIVFMVDARRWTEEDQNVLSQLEKYLANNKIPVILGLNKVDMIKHKEDLLPIIESAKSKYDFTQIIPLCAESGENVSALEEVIDGFLPTSPFYFPPGQVTDRNERFIASEMVREQLMRLLGDELPYCTAVEIEQFEDGEKLIKIAALIWVEREGQKQIVIGEKGERLKLIGKQARLSMEAYFGKKVFLQVWVKVKRGWSDSQRVLREFGYDPTQ